MKYQKIEASSEGLKDTKLSEWISRFVFGGFISLVAGLVSQKFGAAIGGLFLAFPSIIPATMSLVKKHDNRKEACDDAYGAAIGAVALSVFGLIVYLAAEDHGIVFALSLATVGWFVGAIVLWFLIAKLIGKLAK